MAVSAAYNGADFRGVKKEILGPAWPISACTLSRNLPGRWIAAEQSTASLVFKSGGVLKRA